MVAVEHDVRIPAEAAVLHGDLVLPRAPRGLVIVAHIGGRGRKSPPNRRVAATLQCHGLATLLFDLLTRDEEAVEFDIGLLAARLVAATDWVRGHAAAAGLPLGYFGASMAAAAALVAAAQRPRDATAIVSRGGRPDLAGPVLDRVRAPTLLIVGGDDRPVIALNERARSRMRAPVVLQVVPGTSHLLQEPGVLDEVAHHASGWFVHHLARRAAA
jgi:putative phosphoribosyl transferase